MLTRRDFQKGLISAAFSAVALPVGSVSPEDASTRLYLNRLTFGAAPPEIDRFEEISLESWLDAQLTMPTQDNSLKERLGRAKLLIEYEDGVTGAGAEWTGLSEMRHYSTLDAESATLLKLLDFSQGLAWEERIRPAREVISASSIRAVHSEAQLREVVTQFWHEHFSVNALKDENTSIFFPQFDKLLRKHALGNFRELLGHVAMSPAMLTYLNNDASKASPANENYARELLELHTLGADRYLNDLYDDWKAVPAARDGLAEGYIDQDVYEVARAFTGWSIGDGRWIDEGVRAKMTGRFEFVEAWHDPYQKRILGVEFAPNSAKMADGERVLDMLSRHSGTAKFITEKLLNRLGIQTPSDEYKTKIVEVFLSNADQPDQIAEVVRAIVLNPEFAKTPATKLKRPFEFLMSLYRATGAEVSSPRYNLHWWLERSGWTQHHARAPTGHSDQAQDWANTRAINGMVDLALYAHDDWFEVGEIDLSKGRNNGETWGELARHWTESFGVDPNTGLAALDIIGAVAENPVPNDPEYVAWGNRTAITLSALSPEFMFR